jgi:predicted PurR-regulated permease PerM
MRERLRSDIVFALALIVALYVAYSIANVLLLIYVSALFAVVLAPAINVIRRVRFGKWQPNRAIAVLVLLICVLGALTLLIALIAPPIVKDAADFAQQFPQKIPVLQERIQRIPLLANLDLRSLQNSVASMLGGAVGFFRGLAGGIFGIFSAIILTVYFILDGSRAFHWALSMVPLEQRGRLERTMHRGENRMRHWLVGQTMLMLILGVLSCLVFGILKLKYFLALGLLAGLLNIVPIVGPAVAITLAGLVALVDSPAKLLGVLIFFVAYQQLENAFLTPRIMKLSVDLPALAVIIALMIGGALAGILGALIAVPTAALCAEIIQEYLVKKDATSAAVLE